MGSTDDISFITKQHDRLLRIAFFSKIFAWIALVFQILYTVLMFFESKFLRGSINVPVASTSETRKVLRSLIWLPHPPNS